MCASLKFIFMALLHQIFGRILLKIREYVLYIPVSVRYFLIRIPMMFPLGLFRFLVNIARSPILEERKWVHRIEKNTWKGVWIVPNMKSLEQVEHGAVTNDFVILYVHGGGFCLGNPLMYMDTFLLIINHLWEKHQLRTSILSLDYSLSPESVWPKACNESMDAYNYLIYKVGIHPSSIVLAGDSAGGNLVATMLLTIKAQKNSKHLLPSAAALLSPWMDLTHNHAKFASMSEDVVSPKRIDESVSSYVPNYKYLDAEAKKLLLRNPLISPRYGDFRDVCPIFISIGEKELLRNSIEDFVFHLTQSGCNLTVLTGENESHIWHVYKLLAQSKQTYERDCRVLVNWIASTRKRPNSKTKLNGHIIL